MFTQVQVDLFLSEKKLTCSICFNLFTRSINVSSSLRCVFTKTLLQLLINVTTLIFTPNNNYIRILDYYLVVSSFTFATDFPWEIVNETVRTRPRDQICKAIRTCKHEPCFVLYMFTFVYGSNCKRTVT